jgi:hypothetical protein
MSLSSEAGSLAEQTLRFNSPKPGNSNGSHGGRSGDIGKDTTPMARVASEMENMLSQPEQAEAVGALRKLSTMSAGVAAWFPRYGHRELRAGAGGASMDVPPRELAENLANGNWLYLY